jgi:tetratricopeptide (TPR) repeat protein
VTSGVVPRLWAVLTLLCLAGCAVRAARPRVDFDRDLFDSPLRDTALAASAEGRLRFEEGWSAYEQGDLRSAGKLFERLLESPPRGLGEVDLHPVHSALGAVELGRGQTEAALASFERALDLSPGTSAGLLGAAAALHDLGDDARAHDLLERFHLLHPGHAAAERLRERVRQSLLAQALDRAEEAERRVDARAALDALGQAALLDPGNPALRMRQGAAGLSAGDPRQAVAAFAAAAALTPQDAEAWLGLGEAHLRAGDTGEAREAFERAATLPGGLDRARERVKALREKEREEVGRRPQLADALAAPVIDRAGLAALLAARLPALNRFEPLKAPVIVTDVSTSWARAEIQQVVALGILEVYDNHTFRPELAVTRTMLARAVTAVLGNYRREGLIAEKRFDSRSLADVEAEHLAYRDVVEALRYGVMQAEGGRFGPTDRVGGAEAAAVVGRLVQLGR